MSTPAEIIAARVNGTYVADIYESSSAGSSPGPESVSTNDTSRSLADESAFPVLGGAAKPANAGSATPWGPNSNGAAAPAPSIVAPVKSAAPKKFKGSTVQEAFSLDAEDQLNVARPEFIKILTLIKADTQTNIECTTSQHTKKRTFLITGKPEQVKLAKRLVIKKLTKPVLIVFSIPAKVRSKIIGVQGRVLKPIILENEVKIDIGQDQTEAEDDDDIFASSVNITIEGDADGCKQAKALILAIVKEETKNLSIKIAVDDFVKPFVAKALEPLIAKYAQLEFLIPPYYSSAKSVIIVGDREAALEARDEVKDIIEATETKIVVESVPIPKVKHQFLPIEQIMEEVNVLIKLPAEGETDVQFLGEKKNIKAAQEKARSTTSQYKVEVLDMSKAHKGNLAHVRAIASLLNKNGTFKQISLDHLVSINPPTDNFLGEANSTLPIEIVVNNDDVENTKAARKAIVAVVNKITPDQTKVVEDIDEFFIARAPAALDKVSAVQYAVLGNKIVLFNITEPSESDDFDFEDSSSDVLEEANRALDFLRELQESLLTVVLEVPAAEQSSISGPKGTTLRSILAAVEPESVTVKLNAKTNEVTVHGLKSEVATVASDIKTVLAEAKEYKETGGYTTTLAVPAFILSRIIGRGGANLNALREEFGVRIDIADEGKANDSSDKSVKTELTIAGIKRNAEEAKSALSKLAKKFADDTTVRLRIESQFHRRIIGPNFESINRLQDKYGVKIRFFSENSGNFADAPKSKDEVTIRGPSKGVAKAEEELKELYEFERENGFKSTIKVPSSAIALVIGKNGDTIRDISDGTGVEFRFQRKEEEAQGFAEVELTGTKSAIKEATKKIDDIIAEVENHVTVNVNVPRKYHRDLVGTSGSVMREIISNAGGDSLSRQRYARLLNIPPEGSESDEVVCLGDKTIVEKIVKQIEKLVADKEAAISEDYDLAKEKHKLIVGPGGSIRHALQDEFAVQIYIPRPNDASTTIKLSGLPENLEKVKAKLDDMTKDNWNESLDIPAAYHSLVSDHGAIFKTLRGDGVEVAHGNFTRKASNLSNKANPAAPEDAAAEDGKTKFTVGELSLPESEDVIPWRLIGEAAATAKAAALISSRLERAQAATNAAWFHSTNSSNHFPRIIGPQGSKINEIRKATGAFITVPRSNDKNGAYIYLVGTEGSLQKAAEAFAKLV